VQVFYPSMVVEFTIMFDESLHIIPDPEVQDISSATVDISPEGLASALTASAPLIMQQGNEDYSFVAARVPKSGSVELQGYRQASQFRFTFDFMELPIDPRTVRAASISVYLDTIKAGDFADGMTRPEGHRQSVLKSRLSSGAPNDDALLMIGTVDEWEVVHNDSGSEVTISGRDLRGLLLDVPLDHEPNMQASVLEQIDQSKPLHDVVRDLLSFAKMWSKIEIAPPDPSEWPKGVPAPGKASASARHRKGAKGDKKSAIANPKGAGTGKFSFWDMIVQFSYVCGAIPYFRGKKLYIRPVKGIYRQLDSGGKDDPTPFAKGNKRSVIAPSQDQIPGGPLAVRRLVYGHDIESVSFDRKFAGAQRPKIVRAVGDNPDKKGKERFIVGVWPKPEEKKARVTKTAPNAKDAESEAVTISVAGISDKTQLEQIARGLYEEIGRCELGGTCTTHNLASFGGDNLDADLLKLKPGDGIEFDVSRKGIRSIPPLSSSVVDFASVSFDQMVTTMTATLGDKNLARVIVATARGQVAELQRFFRVSHVSFAWSVTDGVKVSFDFQNFIEARADVGPKVGKKSTKSKGVKSLSKLAATAPDMVFTLEEMEGL
jgi:hypothetical protein